MMKIISIHAPPARLRAVMGAIAGLVLCAFLVPGVVEANTAADTVIRNTATVNYQDAALNAQAPITAQVDITVSLIASTPALNAPTDQSTDSATAAVYNYTITSTANGPDIYDLTATVTAQSAGISGSTAVPSSASINLGATTVAATASAGDTVITVPNDLNGADSAVNGIAVNDVVVIGGTAYTVTAITDNGGTPGATSTITIRFLRRMARAAVSPL